MLSWRHGPESLAKADLKGNGRADIEDSEFGQLPGGVLLRKETKKWNSCWQERKIQTKQFFIVSFIERSNNLWCNDRKDPLEEGHR